eukprot:CAMPEP_0116892632 /NCGR_PEP_ID=MMETSP0467-20121206/2808_1 /TAXON_ID=283647 /ORGANISM="Mesodinium pulex, Strain SPMC105" /LENGTH=110 /DNA_ID=CAMNT_0004561861 /DNA_START=493 /DNA_END=825 /DNA_ORIENTATION=+
MFKSTKFETTVPLGELIVDNNAGALMMKYKNENNVEVVDNIPTDTIADIKGDPTESLVSVSYSKDVGGKPEVKTQKIEFPILPKGIEPDVNDKLFYSHKAVITIDSAINT